MRFCMGWSELEGGRGVLGWEWGFFFHIWSVVLRRRIVEGEIERANLWNHLLRPRVCKTVSEISALRDLMSSVIMSPARQVHIHNYLQRNGIMKGNA